MTYSVSLCLYCHFALHGISVATVNFFLAEQFGHSGCEVYSVQPLLSQLIGCNVAPSALCMFPVNYHLIVSFELCWISSSIVDILGPGCHQHTSTDQRSAWSVVLETFVVGHGMLSLSIKSFVSFNLWWEDPAKLIVTITDSVHYICVWASLQSLRY